MYYFAYGSNMNWPQMQQRCPSSRFVSIACLADYRFGITRHSRLRNCGTANVYPVVGESVWGILYDIDERELAMLDGFEDGYRRERLPMLTTMTTAESVDALVYVAAIERDVPLPNPQYKRLMIEGARHWGLPTAYQTLLEAIETGVEPSPDAPLVDAAAENAAVITLNTPVPPR